MEKYGLSVAELEAQHVELLPDRIEMRMRRRRRIRRGGSGLGQDCDALVINAGTGVLGVPILSGNTTCVAVSQ